MRGVIRILAASTLLLASAAQALPADATKGLSGLKVPRFVSIAAGEANMRSGPGDRYPVSWVYQREGLPVEVVREYGIWRQVRDPQGGTGWVNKGLLTGTRTAYVMGQVRTLYARSDLGSKPVWRAEPGVVAKILLCEGQWCRVSIDGKSGYILRAHIWGTYPNESVES